MAQFSSRTINLLDDTSGHIYVINPISETGNFNSTVNKYLARHFGNGIYSDVKEICDERDYYRTMGRCWTEQTGRNVTIIHIITGKENEYGHDGGFSYSAAVSAFSDINETLSKKKEKNINIRIPVVNSSIIDAAKEGLKGDFNVTFCYTPSSTVRHFEDDDRETYAQRKSRQKREREEKHRKAVLAQRRAEQRAYLERTPPELRGAAAVLMALGEVVGE